MALTGTLLADFSNFTTAVANAEVTLKSFEAGGAKVESTLTRASDALSGVRIVQQATIGAEAVDRIGGVAMLTERELARIGATAIEARNKLVAMGEDVPPKIQAIADAAKNLQNEARASGTGVQGLAGALGQFDGVLASMGVRLGPQIRALGELGEASGKTAGQIGLVGTAGLVAGAVMGGWQIGRAVSDWFDLDKTIGDATAKLLGWGDVAGQVAGAQADVLARASKTAGFAITDLTTAIEINKTKATEWRTQQDISTAAVKGWQTELARVQAAGNLDSLTADLASQNFALADLATRYRLSVDALEFFARAQTAAAKATKEADAAIVASNKEKLAELKTEAERLQGIRELALETTAGLWADYYSLQTSHGGTANEQAIADIARWKKEVTARMVEAGADTDAFYKAMTAMSGELARDVGIDWGLINSTSIEALQEVAANARATYNEMAYGSKTFTREALDAQLQKTYEAEDAARGMGTAYVDGMKAAQVESDKLTAALAKQRAEAEKIRMMGGSRTYDLSNAEGMAEFKKLNPMASVSAPMEYFLTHTLEDAVRAGLVNFYAGWLSGSGAGIHSFAGGVQNFRGGMALVGERGPELVNLPSGSSVFPSGTGGGGSVVHVHPGAVVLQYPILRDRQAMSQIGEVLGEAVVQHLASGGTRLAGRR